MKEYEGIIKKLKKRRSELELRLNKIGKDLRKPHAQDSKEQALECEHEDVLEAWMRMPVWSLIKSTKLFPESKEMSMESVLFVKIPFRLRG